jgi:hypothetical protein
LHFPQTPMSRGYTFLPLLILSLAGAAWWSQHLESRPAGPEDEKANPHSTGQSSTIHETRRRELMEALDRMVSYQHYYHSVYGQFTLLMARTGYSLPSSVTEVYDVRVQEATSDHLIITAVSELHGKALDRVSINQDYQLQSNFALPSPRAEYLHAHAKKHLRTLRNAPKGVVPAESGVFRGYFRYDVTQDSQGHVNALAVGIRPPVMGIQVDFADRDLAIATEEQIFKGLEMGLPPAQSAVPGQKAEGGWEMTGSEQAYLAQKIYMGEVGRYARNWAELSSIASFRFEEKLKEVPKTKWVEIDLKAKDSRPPELEVEPITDPDQI